MKVSIARLEEYGGWGLTVDFGILLMRKMDDETCWSEFRVGWVVMVGRLGVGGGEWGRLRVGIRVMRWEVVRGVTLLNKMKISFKIHGCLILRQTYAQLFVAGEQREVELRVGMIAAFCRCARCGALMVILR